MTMDLGGLADDDAHAVVDDETAADLRAGVDLDAGAAAAALGDEPREEKQLVIIAPVGQAVTSHRADAGVEQQNFQRAARRGIARLVGGDQFFHIFKHNFDPFPFVLYASSGRRDIEGLS